MTEKEQLIQEQSWHNGYLAGVKAAEGDLKRMPYVQFFDKVHTIEWLEDILKDYKGHLELSMEALVVDKRFTQLFSDEEANNALMRLLDAGYRFG